MRKILSYTFATLNGFYKGPNEDIGWNVHNTEENEFAEDSLQYGATLLFGRVTYEMMAGFWPTPAARSTMPAVAEGMNRADKIVFSRTLRAANWENTQIIGDNMLDMLKTMKQQPGQDMTLLGSGSILTQLAEHGLIDEYQIMLNPVALGAGTPLFQGLQRRLDLRLSRTRTFKNGNILLCYQP